MQMSPTDMNSMFQLGATAFQMTSAMRQKQKANRLAIVDGALHAVDRAIESVDFAYNAVSTGEEINYQTIADRTQNALDAVQSALTSLRAAGAGQAGLGFGAPLGPAFGPSGGGPGMVNPMMPQGIAMTGNSTQRSLGPQLQQMRGQLRGARQLLSRLRTAVLADSYNTQISAQGLGEVQLPNNRPQGVRPQMPLAADRLAPPELFPYANTVKTGLGLAAFYHGYKRNNGSIFWGALWGLPGVLGRSFELSALLAVLAYAQGFAEPAKPKKTEDKT
jgi:hypothetical protein